MSSLGDTARATHVTVSIGGIDISSQIGASLTDLTYRECFRDKVVSHSLDLTIADPEAAFRLGFSLDPFAEVKATISQTAWNGPGTGTITKTLSTMYIRSVSMRSSKGAGTSIKISCTSIPPQAAFRLQRNSASFVGQKLSQIAATISKQNGFNPPQYLASSDPIIQRSDQHDFSDADIFQSLTTKRGGQSSRRPSLCACNNASVQS
jgi:phage protein D